MPTTCVCVQNLLVPVGGGVIASPSKDFITAISKTYPGRASSAPVVDVFVTLLHLGEEGYMRLVKRRKELMVYLRSKLAAAAAEFGERVLAVPNNPISCAMSLSGIARALQRQQQDVTFFGSMLFARRVSGTRVVSTTATKEVAGITFKGYGAHVDEYPVPYMTAAAAVGLTEDEVDVDVFIDRLRTVVKTVMKKASNGDGDHGDGDHGDGDHGDGDHGDDHDGDDENNGGATQGGDTADESSH
ncbi:hypothetical protein PTSG_08006 [Salpingoeca rosetta]|uniref:O-phosphoseryl-tRNA(Sec) selenium transferase n=1 Tax=Salpingoeca rosetta (strain ATCC 50818 / BSB-021) TaxID=946362 RepID=F2UHQ7_SALR5|nr:uncharacterized protein PTSG_08006 [Salpingoeca rosetta]EGD76656.1 hypothetical protein PTSG_08006 [Salpingoeca rosetta]|eukprot:XP_004991028.1 hypothetical protein PTSG_08006 [Salpingoeca rosetta]